MAYFLYVQVLIRCKCNNKCSFLLQESSYFTGMDPSLARIERGTKELRYLIARALLIARINYNNKHVGLLGPVL